MRPVAPAARVAIIGGGLAGLTCARALRRWGVTVTVFDKARKAGGRLSTRRHESGPTFDHGAQYFTVRNPWFRRALSPLVEAGAVAPWTGRVAVVGPRGSRPASPGTERWVGVPTMSAIPRALAHDIPLEARTRITTLVRHDEGWTLRAEDGQRWAGFDRVVIAIPSAQAAALLDELPALQREAEASPMHPCWAVMLTLEAPVLTGYDGAFIERSPLSWVMRQPSKPGRPAIEAWVLHAAAAWTEQHWDDEPADVMATLVAAWRARGGPPPSDVVDARAHRWRYASVDPHEPRALGDERAGVFLAGDWLGGGRVEGAFLSGRRAAAAVLRSLRRSGERAARREMERTTA